MSEAPEPVLLPEWEIIVSRFGGLVILRYADEEEARNTYARIHETLTAHTEYRNDDKKVLHITDLMGQHALVVSQLQAASLIHRRTAMALTKAMGEDAHDFYCEECAATTVVENEQTIKDYNT